MGVSLTILLFALAAADASQPYLVSANAMKVQSLPADRITWLFGNVEITHGATVLRGDSAWASSASDKAVIWGHFRMTDRTVVITGAKAVYTKQQGRAVVYGAPKASDNGWNMDADSIVYLKSLTRSQAYGRVRLSDSTGRNRVFGSYGEYWHDKAYGVLTGRPKFVMSSEDTAKKPSFIYADTMEIEQNGALAVGTGDVRYEGDSVWASCGRLSYYKPQGRIVLERQPRIWEPGSEIRARDITMQLEGDAFKTVWARDSVTLLQFGASSPDTDMITGDSLWAAFEQKKIARAKVMDNAWSRYHQLAKDKTAGRNLAAGALMDFTFRDGRIARITITGGARGAYLETAKGKAAP
ncbi:MAG: LptA/OstA family protein [Candidatus Edwardsbacteria bacterium]|nr:LptA/OstA family protein [Candidatus Edwardsbacteria bacterium]